MVAGAPARWNSAAVATGNQVERDPAIARAVTMAALKDLLIGNLLRALDWYVHVEYIVSGSAVLPITSLRARDLLLRPRLALRLPLGRADQRALRRGGAGAAGVAAGAARGAVPALRSRIVVGNAGAGGRDRGDRAAGCRLWAAADRLAAALAREHAGRDAGGDLRQADRPHRLLLSRRLPPGLRRRARPHRRRQRDDRRRRLRAAPAGAVESGRNRRGQGRAARGDRPRRG